uniref:Translation elongation factor EF1B beta/delta subunit guanine nucleotide exchange domain-containing protein n=1 Tax=Colobus angolensis palliatus TaxID=336983 RepID=A0A2K5J3A1_COLAP
MATNFLVHEKIWLDKFKYDHAERRFYEQMNGPVCPPSSWTHWSGGPPSWCPWATVSGSYRFSVWWRTRRRSPSLSNTCKVLISQLSTKCEA